MRVLFARLTFAVGIGVPGCFVWMGVFAMVAGGWGVLLGPAIIVPGLVGLGIGWGVAMLVAPSSSLDDGMLASVLCLFAIGPLVRRLLRLWRRDPVAAGQCHHPGDLFLRLRPGRHGPCKAIRLSVVLVRSRWPGSPRPVLHQLRSDSG